MPDSKPRLIEPELPRNRTYRNVRLYLNDLRQIETQILRIGRVHFRGPFENVSSVDDLHELEAETLPVLEMGAHAEEGSTHGYGRVSLTLKKSDFSMSWDGEHPAVDGVVANIESVMKKGTNRWFHYVGSPWIYGLSLVLVVIYFVLLGTGELKDLRNSWIGTVVMFGALVCSYTFMFRRCHILLRTRRERPGVLKRNRDAIIIGGIFTVVGFLLGKIH